MNIATLPRKRWGHSLQRTVVGAPDEGSTRVYAITFDLNQAKLKERYPTGNHLAAYEDISRELGAHGFVRQQQSVYFGPKGGTPVTCVLAVQSIQKIHPWFRDVVNDIRMLRIEEFNDLYPALGEPELQLKNGAAA